jgi:ATP-dependent Clp protease ATP-binding subunit ClpA
MNKESPDFEAIHELSSLLPSQILGQPHALARIMSVLRRGQLGLRKPGRPLGTFLLLGPTGTGKTESILVFTHHLFGREALIRLDMSEFQTQASLGILIGSQPGEDGYLGAERRRVAAGTLLLDEIEKAHPRVLDLCLQLLDAARITTASGETLDFSNFYIALTSNIGGLEIMSLQYSSPATLERFVATKAQHTLRPELFARIDEVLVFHPLDYDIQVAIAQKFLDAELKFIRAQGFDLTPEPEVLPFLVRKGFHPRLGARPMRGAIEKFVGDAVAEAILRGQGPSGRLIPVRDDQGERLRVIQSAI